MTTDVVGRCAAVALGVSLSCVHSSSQQVPSKSPSSPTAAKAATPKPGRSAEPVSSQTARPRLEIDPCPKLDAVLQTPIEIVPSLRAIFERLLLEVTDKQLRPKPKDPSQFTEAQIEQVLCGAAEGQAGVVLIMAQMEGKLPTLKKPYRCTVKRGFSLDVGANWSKPGAPVIWHFQSIGRGQYAAYRQADERTPNGSPTAHLLASGRLAMLQVFDLSQPGPGADITVYLLDADSNKELVARGRLSGGGLTMSPDATGVWLTTNDCQKHYELQ